MHQSYQVKLDAFEGPLDLLLHLVKQYEIDIYDIPVAEITEQYMEYVRAMQRLELNIASEYLVMAATLLALKSQMLLPQEETDEEEDTYMEDPHEELMERLMEYRKYKEAAAVLGDKEGVGTFTRPPVIFEEILESQPVVKGNTTIYDMLQAVDRMLKRKEWTRPMTTSISRTDIPIEERMRDILDMVQHTKESIRFEELFDIPTRPYIVATFMALLELMKDDEIRCEQEKQLGPIFVFHRGESNGN